MAQVSSAPMRPAYFPLLTIAAWTSIVLCVALLSGMVMLTQFYTPRKTEISRGEYLNLNITAKTVVSLPLNDSAKEAQIELLATGPLEQRYAHAILLGEIDGPERALEQLKEIDAAVKKKLQDDSPANPEQDAAKDTKANAKVTATSGFPSEIQSRIREITGALYQQYSQGDFDTSTVPDEDRDFLVEQMGFVGRLALLPEDSTDQAARKQIEEESTAVFNRTVIAAILGFFAFLAAIFAAATLYGLWYFRQSKSHFVDQSNRGFVYLETFAGWLAIFIALQLGIAVVLGPFAESLLLYVGPAIFFVSLLALVWPVVRGVPVSVMLDDIGWNLRNPLKEILVGGFCYLGLLIPLFFGLVLTVFLEHQTTTLFPPGEFESRTITSHPIEEEIASGDPTVWIMMFVATVVAAPIVEETFFRGVLYRYLRDATGKRFSQVASIAISAIANGVMFAAIHPQGILAIPVLASLAIGFSLVREWRGSIIAPMVMHAIHNGIITTVAITMMG